MQIMPTISPALLPSVLSAENRHPATMGGLPKDGLIFYAKAPGLTDSIGLSASDYLSVPVWLRDIFFSDPSTLRAPATIITNIEASAFLNDGGELVGDATKGYALYADGTAATVLAKAYKFFKEVQPPLYADDIKSLVTATGGVLASPVGPTALYSAAAGQVPDGLGGVKASTSAPVHDAGYYGGPTYSNVLKTISLENYTFSAFIAIDGEAITVTDATKNPNTANVRGVFVLPATPVISFDVKQYGCRYCVVANSMFTVYAVFDLQEGVVGALLGVTADITDVGNGYWRCRIFTALTAGNQNVILAPARTNAVNGVFGATGIGILAKNPMAASVGAYALPVVPALQSVVSTVGTTTNNGVRVPLTGSDAADALYECFAGPNGNDAVGTVAVLMKMGASASNIPNGTILDWLSIKGASSELLFSSTGSSGEDNIGNSNDGATTAAVAATAWTRDQYLLLVVEYSLSEFRVGAQRYSSAGVAVDADIVWSHATLAAGATFDGSWNPTTFERLFLNNTVPNHFKARFVSNQAGLGDAEIIRRLRKYGKF